MPRIATFDDLLAAPSKHKQTIVLLGTLRARDWTMQITRPEIGGISFNHPAGTVTVKTPEYVPHSWWGEPEYTITRALSVLIRNDPRWGTRITLIQKRDARAPWVEVNQQVLNFKAAMTWIEEEWPS